MEMEGKDATADEWMQDTLIGCQGGHHQGIPDVQALLRPEQMADPEI
jgi:hypothetical protein